MANQVLAVVKFSHKDALAKDQIVNTFAFEVPDLLAATLTNITNAVIAFYNTPTASFVAVSVYMSSVLSRAIGAAVVELYDITPALGGGPHGSPIRETFWNLGAANETTNLPSEVSVCLSFLGTPTGYLERGPVGNIPTTEEAIDQGAPAGTHLGITKPRARRRGRIYLGPLVRSTVSYDGNDRPYVAAPTRLTIAEAARRLIDLPNIEWSVWSRRNAALVTVTAAYVDDAFDTQRRRGEAKTTITVA